MFRDEVLRGEVICQQLRSSVSEKKREKDRKHCDEILTITESKRRHESVHCNILSAFLHVNDVGCGVRFRYV